MNVLYKTRCPKCAEQGRDRSGDNLAVYADGGTYCFSCGHSNKGSIEGRLNKAGKQAKPLRPLPHDTGVWLAPEAMDWLHRYFPDTRDFPQCFWSESTRYLIFPIFGTEAPHYPLLAWQARYLGDNPDHPKWVGYGITEKVFHPIGMPSSTIVLVEDLISAHKVAGVGHREHYAMPLFGSHIGLQRLANLKNYMGVDTIVIWLDEDKKEYSIKAAKEAQSIGLQVRTIITERDPKDHTYEEINKLLE